MNIGTDRKAEGTPSRAETHPSAARCPNFSEEEKGQQVPIDSEHARAAFDAVLGAADYPVWLVTTASCGTRAGCLVGFGAQLSIDPPRFVVGLSENNHTFRVAADAEYLAVHLPTDENAALVRLFATETGDTTDKFARCEWTEGPHGLPILSAVPYWFTGRILARYDFGDHVGIVLEPTAGHAADPGRPALRTSAIADLPPGHEA
ncbi:flavin reductase family protein [Nocardia lijiangensis]|uniref:flavin reductase family protein n=1 Tax=Nocardia lijiangensis TaxID=299618 RepID=UPI003D7319E8